MYSVEWTVLQKVICGLFLLTICSSVITLGFFFIEKPNDVKLKCETKPGLEYKMQEVNLGMFTPVDVEGVQRVRNCTIKINPPMSATHQLVTDITMFSGAMFIVAAIIAYALRKRDPLDPKDLPEE